MNRRREHRFKIERAVQVTELEIPPTTISARLGNFSATGAALIVDRELVVGTALRIECGQTLLYGTVIHCTSRGGEYTVGVELEDALYASAKTSDRVQISREPQRKARASATAPR
jgi:hypothetical protein